MSAGYLVILNDPAGVTGVRRIPLDFDATLQDNIARHLSGGAGVELRINGQAVDPMTDPRLDRPPSRLDSVVLAMRPEGFDPLTLTLIAVAALTVGIYTLIPRIDAPSSTAGKQSPNNSLTAQTNIARAYQAIPDVYGTRRVWPDLLQPSTVEYIDHVKYVTEWLCVSLGIGNITEVQYGDTPIDDVAGASWTPFFPTETITLPPGGVAGYPEFLGAELTDVIEAFRTPDVNGQELVYPEDIVTADGVDPLLEITSGSDEFTIDVQDGAYLGQLKSLVAGNSIIVDFTATSGAITFNNVGCTLVGFTVASGRCVFTLTSSAGAFGYNLSGAPDYITLTPGGTTAYTVVGPFTLPISNATRIRWNTIFLRGLKGTVEIEATWWKDNGSGGVVGGSLQTQTFSYTANTYDARYYTNEVTPSAGSGLYRIQFRRLTAEIGSQGTDIAKLEDVFGVRYYATKTLPGVTVIRVTTKATEQATGFAERKFNLMWTRYVRTLTTNTLGLSRNFARALAHLWTINGQDMAELDTTALAAINTEFGEDDDLLRFDMSFDDRDMSLGERMQTIAAHARCTLWRDGTKWTVTRDQARTPSEVEVTFDYRNLSAGGESVITDAMVLPGSHDGIELEYVDETTQAKKAYVRLTIASGAVAVGASANPKPIKLPGCTTATQATNRARLEARKLLYQRRSVADKAMDDAWGLGPGSLVRWVDPNDFGGADDGLQAGEVMSISGTTLRTSEPLDFGAEVSGRIMFTDTSGQRLAAPVVCTPTADPYVVTLASAPAGIFVASSTRQLGSRYVFGVGLSESEIEAAGLYTVVEVKPDGRGEFSLALVNYDERVYADD